MKISAIIPVYNEEASIPSFYQKLNPSLLKISKDSEIIFMENGSSDDSLKILKKIADKDKKVKVLQLPFPSKSEALEAGFQKAKGKFIFTLDADLQDRPDQMEKLYQKMKATGADLVVGWRRDRKDIPKKILLTKIFNYVVTKSTGLKIHDLNCGLKLFKKEVVEKLTLYGEMHRFIPVIVSDLKFKVDEVKVEHDRRKFGTSKYGNERIFKGIFDYITTLFLRRYGRFPLHFFGLLGFIFLFLGLIINIYLAVLWFGGHGIGQRPLLTLGVLLMIIGAQFFSIGFLGEIVIYYFKTFNKNG
jgi:glycosyltransferase involved in cell wall biosynthesis